MRAEQSVWRLMNENETNTGPNGQIFSTAPMDPSDLSGIAKRGWPLWMLCAAIGLACGIAVLATRPPSYKAGVRVMLEHSANNYLQSYRVTDGPSLGNEAYSQNLVVSSEDVVLPVVRKLDLVNDPDIGCPAEKAETTEFDNQTTGGIGTFVQSVKSGIKSFITAIKTYAGLQAPKLASQTCDENTVYRSIVAGLEVWWQAQPAVMNLSFGSRDPEKAAHIANELAESYIASTLQTKRGTTELATKVLNDRIADLRTRAADAEKQVLKFKLKHDLGDADALQTRNEQMESLGEHVANARIAMVDAQARWEGVQKANSADELERYIPDNDLIIRLRERYLDLSTSAVELERRVGKRHSATKKLRYKLADISATIEAERKRIASSYGDKYEVAKAQYDELVAALPRPTKETAESSTNIAQLRELENSAETLRGLYSSMLKRATEENKLGNSHLVLPYARILSHASVPTRTESSKKRLLVLAGSSFFGLLLGMAISFWRNWPIGVFRTPGQVKRSLGLMSVVVPQVKSGSNRLGEYCLDSPHSRFAESVRFIWSTISVAQRKSDAKVICVATALAGEGKTTIAANLANQVSRYAGLRTLLIDADFHQQSLSRTTTPDAKFGLLEALEAPHRFTDFITPLERSGVHVLPCPLGEHLPNAGQLLGSSKMEDLLCQARDTYDIIIVEPPPSSVLADFRMLAPFCDGFVFVVEWGKTSQRAVFETFNEVHELWERVLCVAINKADTTALKSIEAYKGRAYQTYFSADGASIITGRAVQSPIAPVKDDDELNASEPSSKAA